MMREILFRGKRTVTGKWVAGDLRQLRSCTAIYDVGVSSGGYIVIPETVGQYTGQVDYENEERIFEGDILEAQNGDKFRWVVDYADGGFYIRKVSREHSKKRKHQNDIDDLCIDNIVWYMLRKIGNIHDNPELLRGDT